MNIKTISNVCAVALVFAHFLAFTPLTHAQSQLQPSPIDGLRFDTPIPEYYGKKTASLYFLSAYDLKTNQILTVKKTAPTPLTVTSATTSSSIGDLLATTVSAEESTKSASEIIAEESTPSALLAELPIDELVEQPMITPLPKATAIAKKIAVTAAPEIKEAASPSVIPSAKSSEKPKSTPTASPTSTTTPSPTATPEPASSANTGGLSADKIFELVNNYRASKGLPPVQKDERACEVARSRAPEIAAEISGGYMHKGIRERKLPYFNSEIIISMRSEEAAVQWWINDYIHRVQMEGDYKYSCAACSGNSCVQEFTNFVPRG